jgi:cardiolipin synthase
VPSDSGDEPTLVLTSGPADPLEATRLMFVQAINSAQERIWIASPYFVPDQAVIAALQLAGLRGVDVRILLPANSDHTLVKLAAYSYLKEAGQTGVKFYWHQDGFMHRKAMLIDDSAAVVGSANFDNRSFRLNFEIVALFMSTSMITQVEDMFLTDLEKSEEIDPNVLEEKSFWFRLAVQASRLASPVL